MTDDLALRTLSDRLQSYCWYSLLALIAWLAVETVALAPAGMSALAIAVFWLIQSLALLLFLPGMRAGRARSAVWLAFVLLFYVIFAVLRAFAPGLPGHMAMIEVVLICGLFTLAIRFVKAKRATQGGAL